MTELVRYEAARQALAEAHRVDEAKNIRDKAVAMQVYAQQAKDRSLIAHATDIRMRAEIRAGELLREMPKNKGARSQSHPKTGGASEAPPVDPTPKLADIGVTKKQSSRWQKLAALSPREQEEKIEQAKQKAESAVDVVVRTTSQPKQKKKKAPSAIGPLDRCTMTVRRIILDVINDMPPSEWDELLAALRDELDDIEKIVRRMQLDESDAADVGHHPARKSA